MEPQSATMPVVRPRLRRRWWSTGAKIVLGVAVVGVLAFAGFWWWSQRRLEAAWNEAVKEAELDLPRWRLMELEEDRPKIPDAENSALHIIALRDKGGQVAVAGAADYDSIFGKLRPTVQLNDQQADLIRQELKRIAKPLEEARRLKDMPRGRFPITYSDDGIKTPLTEHAGLRQIGDWLQHDAMLLADEGKIDLAIESCQAMVHAGRAMEGDLFFICFLIRIVQQRDAITALERVLTQGEASEKTLQAMQATLERDVETSGWLALIRGERALCHHLFENVRLGKANLSSMQAQVRTGTFDAWLVFDTFPSLMLKYYPEHLRTMNRVVDIAKLPIHERGSKLAEFEREWILENEQNRNLVSVHMLPALQSIHTSEARSQGLLRATAVALACERYRLKHRDYENAWPASLDVLVKEKLIESIQLDPVDGQPLRYRRTNEGIVVYSIGPDGKDDQGKIDRASTQTDPGIDIGFRLWNVAQRRQPALPPVQLKDEE